MTKAIHSVYTAADTFLLLLLLLLLL